MRMVGGMMAGSFPDSWEASPHFLNANSNKLGVTLDLNDGRGRDLLDRLSASRVWVGASQRS